MSAKRYLGDAVYADWSTDGDLVVTTEDGIRATNVIVFEPEVLGALLDYLATADLPPRLAAKLRPPRERQG